MESLDTVLPYLRPRSAELTWYAILLAVLFCVGFAILVGTYIVRGWRQRQQTATTFLNQAAEQGLDDSQARFLLHQARQKRLNNPLLLLNSVYVFDRHLGNLAAELTRRDPADPRLDTIAGIRSILGFDELPADQAQRSTRQLSAGQTLVVWTEVDDVEEYSPWVVVSRDERAIVAAPLLKNEQRQFDTLYPGAHLVAHFWREGDTEYRFVTEVLDLDPQGPSARLSHVDRIERLQHRDFFRLPTHFPIPLYVLPAQTESPPPGPESLDREEQEEGLEESDVEIATPGKEEKNETVPDLEDAVPVYGQVLNLSGGGLLLATAEDIPSDSSLLVDPALEGPFPLQGILCHIVHRAEIPEGFGLQLRFVSLAPSREREIVRLIYQHQIQSLREFSDLPPDHAPSSAEPPADSSPPAADTSS